MDHGNMDHGGMNHRDMSGMSGMPGMSGGAGGGTSESTADSTMSLSSMAMTFFQSTTTPLLFRDAKPTTQGQYAGACIVLVLLAILACVLVNFKAVLQRTVWTLPEQQLTEQPLLRDDEKAAAKAHHEAAPGMSPAGPLGARAEARRWLGAWRSTSFLQRLGMASYEIVVVSLGYVL